LSVVSWILRSLLGIGGVLLVYFAWPVAWGAWYEQDAGTVVDRLRDNKPIAVPDAVRAIEALDRGVLANPRAQLRLARSEVLAGVAWTSSAVSDGQREKWLRTAEADLESGLAEAPAHGIAWLRLAAVRQALDGPSARVVAPLLVSIDTAPIVPRLWPARLEMILRNWQWFTDPERDRMAAYVAMTWHASSDRRWFVRAIREPLDELYIRLLLGDRAGVQEEFSVWIGLVRR
jgi:hypothetical protein